MTIRFAGERGVLGLSTCALKLRGLSMNGTMAASSHRIMLGPLVAAIDQGTSSTRFLVRAAPDELRREKPPHNRVGSLSALEIIALICN